MDALANIHGLLEEVGFKIIKEEEKIGRLIEIHADEPVPNANEQWYLNTSSSICGKAHELGLMSDADWNEFKAGIAEEAKDLKKDYRIVIGLFVAQVSIPVDRTKDAYQYKILLAETPSEKHSFETQPRCGSGKG